MISKQMSSSLQHCSGNISNGLFFIRSYLHNQDTWQHLLFPVYCWLHVSLLRKGHVQFQSTMQIKPS